MRKGSLAEPHSLTWFHWTVLEYELESLLRL